eukprot:EG_transcript_11191
MTAPPSAQSPPACRAAEDKCVDVLPERTAEGPAHDSRGEDRGQAWASLGTMALNVLLTVSIVMINKALFTRFHFRFAPTLLLTLHQLTCAVGTQLSSAGKGGGAAPKGDAAVQLLIAGIVLTRVGGNVLVNLSLKFNTVGMYQLYKMLQVPFVFVGEVLFMDTRFCGSIAATLVVLLLGVGLATVNDLSFSLVGTVCGCVAPLLAAANALLLKHVQVRHNITGNELLRQIAPWVVLMQAFIIPITDDLNQLPGWLRDTTWLAVALVVLSCFIAWALEWSLVVVLNYTSAMSVQVLGHVKTMLILVAGVVLFHSPISAKSTHGILIAFVAVVLYSYLKTAKPSNPARKEPLLAAPDRKPASMLFCGVPTVIFLIGGGIAVFRLQLLVPLAL